MPIKRKAGAIRRTLGPLETEHLQSGRDHLLAGRCWICERGIESARSAWAGRDVVLGDWQRLAFPFPCLAQILFDGERLPPLNREWRALFVFTHEQIADELAALDVARIGRDA